MRALRWIGGNFWWLPNGVAAGCSASVLGLTVAGGTKVSRLDVIIWISIALAWMGIQFLTEVRARNWQRVARAADAALRVTRSAAS